MRFDQVAHDREAEAGSAFFARTSCVDAIEPLEDAAEVLRRNAAPGVAHAERRAAARRSLGAHGHAAARCMTHGVLDEVDNTCRSAVGSASTRWASGDV